METASTGESRLVGNQNQQPQPSLYFHRPWTRSVRNHDDVGLSTRNALQRPRTATLDQPSLRQRTNIAEQPGTMDVYGFAKLDLPKDSMGTSAPPQMGPSNPNDVEQQSPQGNALIRTIRRVFSRSRQGPFQEDNVKQTPKTERAQSLHSRSESYWTGSAQRSIPNSSKISQDSARLRNVFEESQVSETSNGNTKPWTSNKPELLVSPSSPPKRLRRTRSTVYRINAKETDRSPLQSPSSAYRTPQASPSKTTPPLTKSQPNIQASPRLHRPPTPQDQPQDIYNSAASTASHSRKDSLDLMRERYSNKKSENTIENVFAADAAYRRSRNTTSSLSMGVGSVNLTHQPHIPLVATAPRLAMEAAGITARLQDLEVRIEDLEQSLTKLKSSGRRPKLDEETARISQEISKQACPTPPSSSHGHHLESQNTFFRESSSVANTKDGLSPLMPLGPAMGTIQPKSDSPSESFGQAMEDLRSNKESDVLRNSLLAKGYHHALHRIFSVVNAEHSARIALEADLNSLKKEINAFRTDFDGAQEQLPAVLQNSPKERPKERQRIDASSREVPDESLAEDDTPFFQIEERDLPAKFREIQVQRQRLGYEDPQSQAAVPLQSQVLHDGHTNLQQHQVGASTDSTWPGYEPLSSKFSFDGASSARSSNYDYEI